jgi:hypothetical protein
MTIMADGFNEIYDDVVQTHIVQGGVFNMIEITENYFMFLIGEINRGTLSKRVHRILQINGRFKYFLVAA